MTTMLSDGDTRARAVQVRDRNVVVDAGAGTGKTTLLVERVVELVAPAGGGSALPLERIAAITFTRRAAGELRLRVRRQLIEALSTVGTDDLRRERLRAALSVVDTAYIGTIHSFADRLLRMLPVEARLGPRYEVVEDRQELVEDTARLLLQGAAHGTLLSRLDGLLAPDLLEQAIATITDALHVGLRPVARVGEFRIDHGLDTLVRGFIEQRDVQPCDPPNAHLDFAALDAALDELIELASAAPGDSRAARWMRQLAYRAEAVDRRDPSRLFVDVAAQIHQRRRASYKFKKGIDCNGDKEVWRRWNRIDRAEPPAVALGEAIVGPLHAWMASRLLRLRPVVLALYEDVKRRRGVLDEIDLLLRLRDLMRDDLRARATYQQRFDHILVDEFQDTDPLQAEIVLYLAESSARASGWADVTPAPGRLTIVGDPQQSIYRFRRADVVTYAEVCQRVGSSALQVQLDVNHRGTRPLVEWTNDRFRDETCTGDGVRFDASLGRVVHRDMEASRDGRDPCAVHVLPFESTTPMNADAWRAIEAHALPRYLRWLVEHSGRRVVDPRTHETRPVTWGDVCVLAVSTQHLPLLFRELDATAVPYSAAGGTLFLGDPLQRRFVLALRALSDPTDGPAAAALRRPPFFAVDLRDLFRARAGSDERGVVADMEAIITDFRRTRFERSPGETARAVLEQTCLGAATALGPNGRQRLANLREVCHLADLLALQEGLDFDEVTARMRTWVAHPVAIDAPPPIALRTVRVMTVHSAKGLEFPVVVLWDGRTSAESPDNPAAWRVSRDGTRWTITLDGLKASRPPGIDLGKQERALLDEERKRLSYVAVTRARDLLVVPRTGEQNGRPLLWRSLTDAEPGAAVRVLEPYEVGRGAPWAEVDGSVQPIAPSITELPQTFAVQWQAALEIARRESSPTVGVTTMIHGHGARTADRGGRFGPSFGTLVHRAIGRVLLDGCDATSAVDDGLVTNGVSNELRMDAVEDVERAVTALRELGITTSSELRVEYPVAGLADHGAVLVGSIDLLAVRSAELWIVDFKTDEPPTSSAATELPAYAAQVRLYGELLQRAGVGAGLELRCALLFTADGSLHEIGATACAPIVDAMS